MIIGVPKEIKDSERRVALTPTGAQVLIQDGHEVVVEYCAGVGSGFEDEEYIRAGANSEESQEKRSQNRSRMSTYIRVYRNQKTGEFYYERKE
jgi:alanine dehydrogenase